MCATCECQIQNLMSELDESIVVYVLIVAV
jgi:hypothetical protein